MPDESRSRAPVLLLAVAAALAPAEAAGQERAAPPDLLGCYAVSLGSWKPDIPLGGDTIYLVLPSRIELTDRAAQVGGWQIRQLMQPNERLRFASWAVEGDEVRLWWSNGFSGARVVLTRRGNLLAGEAETYWDFQRETQRATVDAEPVECAAEGAP